MDQHVTPSTGPGVVGKVRLWCLRAAESSTVAVFARCKTDRYWTCVLRWNWENGKFEEGAWTAMDVLARRCALSPDGKFLLFAARGSPAGPFSAASGGAYAVSYLPWLLTLTHPRTVGTGAEQQSRESLRPSSQRRLWAMFQQWMDLGPVTWPRDLGMGWMEVPVTEPVVARLVLRHGARLAARIDIGDGLYLLAVIDRPVSKQGTTEWSIWTDDLRFFVVAEHFGSLAVELADASWAAPAKGGRVLLATTEGALQVHRFDAKTGAPPVVERSVSLSGLTPRPGPAPRWARGEI